MLDPGQFRLPAAQPSLCWRGSCSLVRVARVRGLLPMVQEQERIVRRLAAILAVDVAGYSRLMGLDEIGTTRTLARRGSKSFKANCNWRVNRASAAADAMVYPVKSGKP